MPPKASGRSSSDLGGCGASRAHGRLICTRSWVLPACRQCPGTWPGKARYTEVPVQGTDYVVRAPGARATLHRLRAWKGP